MITRRQFLKLAGAAVVMPWGCTQLGMRPSGILLNDVHSGMNPTTVRDVIPVRLVHDIRRQPLSQHPWGEGYGSSLSSEVSNRSGLS